MKLASRIFAFAIMLLAMAACKPTEQNYKAAYDRAIAGREAQASQDGDEDFPAPAGRDTKLGQLTTGGVSYPVSVQFVSATKDGGGINEYVRKYMVAAGQFKQLFNAKMMRERLTESGYPGAFVVQNGEPYYFVIAGSYSDIAPAIEMYNKLKADTDLKIKAPLPFFLCPSQIR